MAYDIEKVTAWIAERGYSNDAIKQGLAYANEHDAGSDTEAASLAMARILYSDGQLEDGAKFEVEHLD